MRDPRIEKLADVLVNYSVKVKKGDLVAIRGGPESMPAIRATFEAVLRAGGNPFWMPMSEDLEDSFFAVASDEQIAYLSPLLMQTIETIDARISFWAETNTKRKSRVDSGRLAKFSAAQAPMMGRFMERSASGALRWVGTQYPTNASAQDAEMSLDQYADFVFRAGLLHLPDPAAAWRQIRERQQRLADWLNTKKSVRFQAPPPEGTSEATDLTVSVDGSTWLNCAGECNFPDGEVFAGPKGVDGVVHYTFPGVYQGREVEGIRLKFKGGRVVEASAKKNEDFLIKMLDQDAGARVLGEIAIGTNYAIKEFSKNTLFDEKIGGTFHAAVGAGYPESGSSNKSGLHWDMVCDLRPRGAGGTGGTIAADGEVFHKDGLFTREGWPGPV
ncbi:MAG: aminopeptidase [Phycisphaerales bacterium]